MGQFTFKSQGSTKPTAQGSLMQASCYGATIPTIYGTTQSPLLAIWAANLRQGGSIKKFKQFKKGITAYVENIDFLLGHNPIMGVLQVMVNGGNYPLDFDFAEFVNSGPYTISDPDFCFVTAVTMVVDYSFAVDDYGGSGPVTLSGTYEIPFWNELEVGPDPTLPMSARNFPYCYRWAPSYGNTIQVDGQAFSLYTFKVYYAKVTAATSGMTPIAKLRLAFEPQLGSGTEYADAGSPFDDQQIIYPHFAGLGSSEIDLGSTGALPQLLPEVRGKWGIYPSMDADFVDMIEDVIKSGIAQAAISAAATPAFTQMERGLSSYNLPGPIQYKPNSNAEFFDPAQVYNLPCTEGNILIVIACGGANSISDSLGNTWTAVLPTSGSPDVQIWWAKNITTGLNTVTTSALGFDWQMVMFEIAGVDTFDVSAYSSDSQTADVTTTGEPGFPEYVMAIGRFDVASAPASLQVAGWRTLSNPNIYGFQAGANGGTGTNKLCILDRTVRNPGEVSIALPGSHVPEYLALLAFKASGPVSYPKPLGDFINAPSFDLVRAQCRANGLWGSLSMNSQSSGSDWVKSLASAANAAPVFLGAQLFLYPYSEVSAAGNGILYTAPTAAGPVANLSDANGDFVGDSGCPYRETANRIDMDNVLQLQCIDRNTNYNQITVDQPDAASIALYGVRKGDPVVNNAVQDPSVARALLGIEVRRNQYGGDSWSFTASARWSLLSPMDLITLTDSLQGILLVPVRITAFNEKSDGSFDGTAEPFVYGMCAPTPLPVTSPTVNPNPITDSAGDVNIPIIFEPVPDLYPGLTGDQLWLVISSASENYGGAQVFVSTDGGSSYNPAPGLNGSNITTGNATTGATVADWPAAADPDTTNDLLVDLVESDGSLVSYPLAAENNFEYPCYVEAQTFGLAVNGTLVANAVPIEIDVDGTAVADLATLKVNGTSVADSGSASFGYELMTYAVAVMTGANAYTLKATGSGNELRRGVFGAPSAGEGVDHAAGSRFALLNPTGVGILKMSMPTLYIGQELFFKVLSFNQFGAALQSLADVTAFTYTPTGIPGAV